MKRCILTLEIEVSEDFDRIDENELDNALADTICEMGHECIESKEYKWITSTPEGYDNDYDDDDDNDNDDNDDDEEE